MLNPQGKRSSTDTPGGGPGTAALLGRRCRYSGMLPRLQAAPHHWLHGHVVLQEPCLRSRPDGAAQPGYCGIESGAMPAGISRKIAKDSARAVLIRKGRPFTFTCEWGEKPYNVFCGCDPSYSFL